MATDADGSGVSCGVRGTVVAKRPATSDGPSVSDRDGRTSVTGRYAVGRERAGHAHTQTPALSRRGGAGVVTRAWKTAARQRQTTTVRGNRPGPGPSPGNVAGGESRGYGGDDAVPLRTQPIAEIAAITTTTTTISDYCYSCG